VRLLAEFLARGLAESLQAGDRHEVGAPNAKRLEFRAVDTTLYPLVNGLAGHRRVNALPGLFDAQVFLCVSITGPSTPGGTTGAKACERLS